MPARLDTLTGATVSIASAAAVNVGGGNVTFTNVTRGVYVGGSGNLAVIFAGDTVSVTLTGLAAGMWHPMQLQQILQSGTTATGILVGY